MQSDSEITEFIQNLRFITQPYLKFQKFIEKAEKEGYLHCIHLTIHKIFEHEINNSMVGCLIRIEYPQENPKEFADEQTLGKRHQGI